MKHLYKIFLISLVIGVSSCSTSRYYSQDDYDDESYYDNNNNNTITYQQFYNDLSPYGNWASYPGYGYVWMPRISNFRPYYTNGHWTYTNYGWTWVSNYNWGWAPFHYGRWINDMRYGWMWLPGYEWAPAWVNWRSGGGYYGWSPMGPGMDVYSDNSMGYDNWTFVQDRYITSPRINNYYINRSNNITVINNTTIINNTAPPTRNVNGGTYRPAYNIGPSASEVERVTNTRIRQMNVETSRRPGPTQVSNNTVRVFRPTVNQQNNTDNNNIQQDPRPQRVTDLQQINRNNDQANPPRREVRGNTPRVNRNEPPVNNRPSLNPNNNTNQENNTNTNQRPTRAIRKSDEVKPEVRTNDNQPVNRQPAPERKVETPQAPPAQPKQETPPQPVRQINRETNTNTRDQNTQPAPVIRRETPAESQPRVQQNNEIRVVRPAQSVTRQTPQRNIDQ